MGPQSEIGETHSGRTITARSLAMGRFFLGRLSPPHLWSTLALLSRARLLGRVPDRVGPDCPNAADPRAPTGSRFWSAAHCDAVGLPAGGALGGILVAGTGIPFTEQAGFVETLQRPREVRSCATGGPRHAFALAVAAL